MRTLDWSFEVVKPHDFLEIFLFRMSVPLRPADRDRARRHAVVLIDLAYTGAFSAACPVARALLLMLPCSRPQSTPCCGTRRRSLQPRRCIAL